MQKRERVKKDKDKDINYTKTVPMKMRTEGGKQWLTKVSFNHTE